MKGEKLQLHIPVALDRCIALLTPALARNSEPILIDATLGMGGHTKALLESFPSLRVIAFDRDTSAIAVAKETLGDLSNRVTIIHAVYDQIASTLEELSVTSVDGVLFDLGVSSMQLDEAERGFAYSQEAPLDMRMDQSTGSSALDILNSYSRSELIQVIRTYGEEKFAPRIVDNIIVARESGRLKSTKDLAEIVKESIPAPARRTGGNPAKRTFQALRIEVNQELEVLERALPQALNALSVGGRIVVMAYQSLEDKIVKKAFAAITQSGTPLGLPIDLPNSAAKFNFVLRGSEGASDVEIAANSRAGSMRLRCVERVAA